MSSVNRDNFIFSFPHVNIYIIFLTLLHWLQIFFNNFLKIYFSLYFPFYQYINHVLFCIFDAVTFWGLADSGWSALARLAASQRQQTTHPQHALHMQTNQAQTPTHNDCLCQALLFLLLSSRLFFKLSSLYSANVWQELRKQLH